MRREEYDEVMAYIRAAQDEACNLAPHARVGRVLGPLNRALNALRMAREYDQDVRPNEDGRGGAL